jgi:DNA-binding NtrC family response regulator
MHDLAFLYLLAEDSNKDTTNFTVTLVDDDSMFIETMKDYLSSMNIKQLEMYSSAEQLLQVLKHGDRRLIILDFDFGDKSKYNGLSALEAIRNVDPKIPVIMLSAQDNMTTAIETLRKGALDYFMKGYQSTFTSVLSSILKINELQKLKQAQKEYNITAVIVAVVFSVMACMAAWQFFK